MHRYMSIEIACTNLEYLKANRYVKISCLEFFHDNAFLVWYMFRKKSMHNFKLNNLFYLSFQMKGSMFHYSCDNKV